MTIRKVNIVQSIDWLTIAMFLVLVIIGWVSIYAAGFNEEHHHIFDFSQRYGKQLIWILATFALAILIIIIDSSFYSVFAYPIFGFIILLLLTVLIFGKEVNGARSWFEIGSVRLQPAEFAKFAVNLAIAKYLSSDTVKLDKISIFWLLFSIIFFPVGIILLIARKGVTGFIPIVLFLFLPVALIILQNDTGSALVYIAFFIVLFREGLSWVFILICVLMAALFVSALLAPIHYIFIVCLSAGLLVYWFSGSKLKILGLAILTYCIPCAVLFLIDFYLKFNFGADKLIAVSFFISSVFYLIYSIRKHDRVIIYLIIFIISSFTFTYSVNYFFNKVLEPHQQNRISILLGLKDDPLGVGYNVNQSKIAIGSGELFGKGFLEGTQTKYDFVPEQTTDFIFCTIGEEWGFMGSFIVISLFAAMLLRLIYLAERQRSKFSRIYGYGLVSILFFHLCINVGMTIGLAPVIGIPLPFISYGGSSLWSFTILLFIFLRLDASRLELLK